jgi:hypothetical protein
MFVRKNNCKIAKVLHPNITFQQIPFMSIAGTGPSGCQWELIGFLFRLPILFQAGHLA